MARPEMESEVDVAVINAAIQDPRWKFRTVEGIAEDLRLSPQDVAQQLAEHPEIARKSAMTDRHGRALYASPENPPTLRERLEQIRWILAH